MNTERLLEVAKVLEQVPDEKFDMGKWSRDQGCGTVACAFGHYIIARPHCGVSLLPDKVFPGVMVPVCDDTGEDGFHAASRHFDISGTAAEFLFNPVEYDVGLDAKDIPKRDVIDRIRAFVAAQDSRKEVCDL